MSTTDQTEDPMRAFARDLFKPEPDETDEPDEQQKPPVGNLVPREGNNPPPARDPDMAMREFTRDLFDNNA